MRAGGHCADCHPEGFPLAYEVMAGNTTDNTTLRGFLKKIEEQYGKAERIWVMDRGIPTEEVLQEMRLSDPPVSYLVGTPKGRLTRYEKALADLPWHKVRDGVDVKLLPQDSEVYILAKSRDRIHKERSMRRRQLKRLWKRLHELQDMELTRDQLLLKLGAARQHVTFGMEVRRGHISMTSLRFSLRKDKLRTARRREGRYFSEPTWSAGTRPRCGSSYTQLVHVEEAFKNLKGDLSLRPIHHQNEKTDRGAHLRRLHGLRASRHLAAPLAQSGAGLNSSGCHREVQLHSDDRCPSPDDGRPHGDHVPVYPTGARTSDSAETTATPFPRSAFTPDGGQSQPG